MLIFLVCKERREEIMNKLVKFIYQLSIEDIKIAVETLKKLICFVKEGREK